MNDKKSVLIIGGGLAGLTSATILAEEGFEVTLVEASPHIGGMVKGWLDEEGLPAEHGIHMIGQEYHNLLAFLRRLSLTSGIVEAPSAHTLDAARNKPKVFHFDTSWLMFLLHHSKLLRQVYTRIPTSLFRFLFRAQGVSSELSESMSHLLFPMNVYLGFNAHTAEQYYSNLDSFSFRQLLHALTGKDIFANQSQPDMNLPFWLDMSAAFHISATQFYMTGPRRLSTRYYIRNSQSIFEPWQKKLESLGVHIMRSTKATRLTVSDRAVRAFLVRGFENSLLETENCVIASSYPDCLSLLNSSGELAKRIGDFDMKRRKGFAIVCRFWVDRSLQRIHRNKRFNLVTYGEDPLELAFVHPTLFQNNKGWEAIEVQGWGSEPCPFDEDQLKLDLWRKIRRCFPILRDVKPKHTMMQIHRNLATYSPNTYYSRPMPGETAVPNIYLAGEWLRIPVVHYMEKAVVSGILATNDLLKKHGRKERFVQWPQYPEHEPPDFRKLQYLLNKLK